MRTCVLMYNYMWLPVGFRLILSLTNGRMEADEVLIRSSLFSLLCSFYHFLLFSCFIMF